ncbi:MAG TPA: MlaD family protein [Candidatus Sulfotelmatobacter sp.]|nr:MlaD family protein [Candidatus Sulfotelmatobacter sp.]
MSKKANPAAIGLFIVIGLALGIGGLILFSSGKLFSRHQKFILYFDASLKGLNPGAPVKYRGVTIGAVDQVLIRHNQARQDYSMPVIIDIDEKLAQAKSDQQLQLSRAGLERMVAAGLRGKLDTESLVTGVLYVELEALPQAEPPTLHQLRPEYPEIPTAPTEIQRLRSNLAQLDIRGLTERVEQLLTRLDTSLGQLNIPEINAGVTNLLGAANRVLTTSDLTNSILGLRRTLENAQGLLQKMDARVDPLVDGATNTLHAAQQTLAELRLSIQNLNGIVEPDAPLRAELTLMLEQLNHAARSIADLAEFLERNPNAVLTGRKSRKNNP